MSRHVYAICGILLVLTAASAGSNHMKKAAVSPVNVFVTNPATSPAIVSGQVFVTNPAGSPIPTSVSNIARVQVENTATTPVPTSGSVAITNTSTNPVPVVGAIPEPFNEEVELDFSPGDTQGSMLAFTAPAGKMLVLTNEYLHANLIKGQVLIHVLVSFNGQEMPIDVAASETDGADQYFTGRAYGQVYIPGGTPVGIRAGRFDDTGAGAVRVGFNGYLIDTP